MKNCFYKTLFSLIISLCILNITQAQVSAQVAVGNTTCGHNNGSATVTPSGGSGYTYRWSNGASATNSETGLASGYYTVTVYSTPTTDSTVKAFMIGTSTGVTADTLSTLQPTCGQNNGKILGSNSSPGVAINIFELNGSVVEAGGGTDYFNAGPGTYAFIVIDTFTGCADTVAPIILSDNSTYPVFTNVAVTADSCFGNDKGSITVTLANCTTGCTYRWSYSASNTGTSATGLPAGIDTFFVSSGGCTNLDTVIHVPGALTRLTDSLTVYPDHCGHHVGSAIVLSGGGTSPYTYTWSMGTATSMQDSISQLMGDTTVSVTVTDSYGCADTLEGAVGNTPGPNASLTPSDTICVSDHSGVLKVTPTAGTGPFTYLWSNGQATNVDAGLAPGGYAVTVYDAVGCDTILQANVPEYIAISSVVYTPSDNVDLGQTVEVDIETNVPVTSVHWDPYIPGSTNNTIVAFKPDTTQFYTATISYGQSCQFIDSIYIGVHKDTLDKFNIPNTFTPNGDGLNDNFKLLTVPDVSTFHIWVYDRWGNKVFEATDVNFAWDGTDQFAGNKPLAVGVYAYVVQYQYYGQNDKSIQGGNISLVK
jgi:gliding motility-associated-like protein